MRPKPAFRGPDKEGSIEDSFCHTEAFWSCVLPCITRCVVFTKEGKIDGGGKKAASQGRVWKKCDL